MSIELSAQQRADALKYVRSVLACVSGGPKKTRARAKVVARIRRVVRAVASVAHENANGQELLSGCYTGLLSEGSAAVRPVASPIHPDATRVQQGPRQNLTKPAIAAVENLRKPEIAVDTSANYAERIAVPPPLRLQKTSITAVAPVVKTCNKAANKTAKPRKKTAKQNASKGLTVVDEKLEPVLTDWPIRVTGPTRINHWPATGYAKYADDNRGASRQHCSQGAVKVELATSEPRKC